MKPPEGEWHVWSESEGERTEWTKIPPGWLWRTTVWSGSNWFGQARGLSVSMVFVPERQG